MQAQKFTPFPPTPAKERKKVFFQFTLMTLMALVMGGMLEKLLTPAFEKRALTAVTTHFEIPFHYCDTAWDWLLCILRYALPDLITLTVIFLAAFTFLNYVITDLALVYAGGRLGLSFLLLTKSSGISFAHRTIFLLFHGLMLALIWLYACQSALLSFHLKRFSSVGRLSTAPLEALRLLLFTFLYAVFAFILDGLYCLLIYIT